MDLNKFKELLSVPSKTYQEEDMVEYLCDELEGIEGVSFYRDEMMNIYATKGTLEEGEFYPMFIAHNHFPEANFIIEDVGSSKFDKNKYNCDISVISATLEHIENYEVFLENVFQSTNELVLIRTFIGNESRKDYCLKPGATQSYLIRQFQLTDLKNKSFNISWNCDEIEDLATGGKQKQVCDGIDRSQRILSFHKII